MWGASANEVLSSGTYRNAFLIDNQREATLHDVYIFVEIVNLSSGGCGFAACPKRHLAAIHAIEDVTLNS